MSLVLISLLQVSKQEEIWEEYDDLGSAIEDAFTKLGISEDGDEGMGEEEQHEEPTRGKEGKKKGGKGKK